MSLDPCLPYLDFEERTHQSRPCRYHYITSSASLHLANFRETYEMTPPHTNIYFTMMDCSRSKVEEGGEQKTSL